jgi:hypothetical protein
MSLLLAVHFGCTRAPEDGAVKVMEDEQVHTMHDEPLKRLHDEPLKRMKAEWRKQMKDEAKDLNAQVMIERIAEQIIGVKAVQGDVKVLDDVPPSTETEYRERHGEAPRRFLFSQTSLQFYTYGRGGARITLKSTDGDRLR